MIDQKEIEREEISLALEHRNVVIAIQYILNTDHGKEFFKYLFKSFDLCELPPYGLKGEDLADRLGFLRAGNSIFKIASEANAGVAASLLAQIEREKHEKLLYEARRTQG